MSFADILKPHLNIDPYIGYVSSLDDYCLQNIWNHVVKHWSRITDTLSEDKAFKKSSYKHIHIQPLKHLTYASLDEHLTKFINGDKLLALIVINAIQDYVYPVS